MTLSELLESLEDKKVSFLRNHGNAGDGLIHGGWHQLTQKAGVDCDSFSYPAAKHGKVLFIVGAGAFCRGFWHGVESVRFYAKRFEKIYVVSASFDTDVPPVRAWLQTLPRHVHIFCRERTSYDALRKLVSFPDHIMLDHDLAFSLDVSAWAKPGQGDIYAFRTDGESALRRRPPNNFDLSNMGGENQETLLLDILSNYRRIYTDRLHVAIAGALLGKEVLLFAGSYHKIKSIYEFSLRRFEQVKLGTRQDYAELLADRRWRLRKARVHLFLSRLPGGPNLLRALKARKARSAPAPGPDGSRPASTPATRPVRV